MLSVANNVLGCRQAVRHGTLTPAFVSSNLAIPARKSTQPLGCVLFSRLSITDIELRHCKAMASFRTADFEFELNFGENHSS